MIQSQPPYIGLVLTYNTSCKLSRFSISVQRHCLMKKLGLSHSSENDIKRTQ